VLLNRSVIQGAPSNSHVTLTTDQSNYTEGGDIVFIGEIEFSRNEQVGIKQVRLKCVNVPVASETLMVKADSWALPSVPAPLGTIPGTTFPGGSDDLKSVTNASKSFTPPNGPRPQATPTQPSEHTVSHYSLNSRTARILKAPAPTTRSSLAPWFRSPARHG
jgi:hypothetical protein